MFEDILTHFQLKGNILRCEPYGKGHINRTFRAETDSGTDYILQRINSYVFKDPVGLMRNIELLCDYLSEKADDPRESMQLVRTHDGLTYYTDAEGEYWRVYVFVADSVYYDNAPDMETFTESGRAFGAFQNRLAFFPVEQLIETIPNFHNTVSRFDAFEKALAEDVCGRAAGVRDEIEGYLSFKPYASFLTDRISSGELPLRVTHNDTKINNILFDRATNRGLCVIDLDTTMPGLPVNDFGDSIRYAANNSAEDDPNPENSFLRMDLFDAYSKGFCTACRENLPLSELRYCPEGAMIMTLECGVRFLADYLMGDVYFHTAYPEHNLVRARTQLNLVRDMERKMTLMHETVDRILD